MLPSMLRAWSRHGETRTRRAPRTTSLHALAALVLCAACGARDGLLVEDTWAGEAGCSAAPCAADSASFAGQGAAGSSLADDEHAAGGAAAAGGGAAGAGGGVREAGSAGALTWEAGSDAGTVDDGGVVTDVAGDDGAAGVDIGCADGQREGFTDIDGAPNIAGCSGAWTIPGIHAANPGTAPACAVATYDTVTPACGRTSGDDGPNPAGVGCNVQDLCAQGWHVCLGASDVGSHSRTGCQGATNAADPPRFFASRQSSTGCGSCATGTQTGCDSGSCASGCAQTADTSNDFFGCGNFGASSPLTDCSPLDRFSHDECSGLSDSSWSCDSRYCEAYTVVKLDSTFGGVLCCRD